MKSPEVCDADVFWNGIRESSSSCTGSSNSDLRLVQEDVTTAPCGLLMVVSSTHVIYIRNFTQKEIEALDEDCEAQLLW